MLSCILMFSLVGWSLNPFHGIRSIYHCKWPDLFFKTCFIKAPTIIYLDKVWRRPRKAKMCILSGIRKYDTAVPRQRVALDKDFCYQKWFHRPDYYVTIDCSVINLLSSLMDRNAVKGNIYKTPINVSFFVYERKIWFIYFQLCLQIVYRQYSVYITRNC